MAQRGFNLFTPPARQPKTVKGEAMGYMTFVMHLAPASLSGFNVCPMATQGCMAACLNTAGRGGMAKGGTLSAAEIAAGTRTNTIQAARIRKTRWFFQDREGFMVALVADIKRAVAMAARFGMKPAFRLNGTSDIRWERIAVDGRANVMAMFPEVTFYDYTKIANRRDVPANYHLTFSLADGNDEQAIAALQAGLNVAAVFRDKETVARYVASDFLGANVVNGDESDLRFLDASPRHSRYWQGNKLGVVVALYAKGNARKDRSGFVRD